MLRTTLRPVVAARAFSSSSLCMSNVGSSPIVVPDGVKIEVKPKVLDAVTKMRMELDNKRKGKTPIHLTKIATITGPRGEVAVELADFVSITEDGNKVRVDVQDKAKRAHKQMWGTTRTLLNNSVSGVSEGHLSIIKFVGTGYRAILENDDKGNQILNLRVGYCVPQIVKVPKDLKVTVPLPHRVIIEGNDKQRVKQLAATIRKYRPPEPYKGKGIFVDGETIKLKNKKVK